MAIFQKKLKNEEILDNEYKYCRMFVSFSEAFRKAGKNPKVSLMWDNERKTIICSIKGDKGTEITKRFPGMNYAIYKRLVKEVQKFKSTTIERRMFI